MKLITLAFVVTSIAITSTYAQSTQGSVMLGGGISYVSTKFEGADEADNTYEISPSIGYFVNDNIAIGIDLTFGKSNTSELFGESVELKTFALGPFARFYKSTASENFSFFAQTGLRILRSDATFNDPDFGDFELELKGTEIYLSPGFTYFFNERWALDLQLAGIRYTSIEDLYTEFEFGTSFFNPTLGVRAFLK